METAPIKTLSVAEARSKLDAGDAVFLDIRDPDSYQVAHIPGAIHINDTNVAEYVASPTRPAPISFTATTASLARAEPRISSNRVFWTSTAWTAAFAPGSSNIAANRHRPARLAARR